MENNIPKLYIIKCAKWFMLVMPIIVLFYQDNGLSMQEIFTLKAIYSIGVVCLEIPSGYLADVWGRKKTLVLGTSLGALGYLTYSLSSGFYYFLIAEILLGIGQSFISGSDSALLYDSLKSQNREDEYLRMEGRVTSIGNFSEAISGIIGGLLATLSLRYPFYGQAFVAFMGVPAAVMLQEPSRDPSKSPAGMKNVLEVVKFCLFKNKPLRSTILFSAIIGNGTLTMAWFLQPYFKEIHIPISMFGIIWTSLNLIVGVVSIYAWRLHDHMSKQKIELLILVGISGGYLLLCLGNVVIGAASIVLFYMIRGIATPILKDYINQLIDSEIRATVLSVRNFVIRILFAMIGPFLGYYTDRFSLLGAFLWSALIVFISGGIVLLFSFRETKAQADHK